MKTFSIEIDEKLDNEFYYLREKLGKASRAKILRMAITLLKVATEGQDKGLKLILADSEFQDVTEIVMPL